MVIEPHSFNFWSLYDVFFSRRRFGKKTWIWLGGATTRWMTLSIVLFVACSSNSDSKKSSEASTFDRKALLTQLANAVILPTYGTLVEKTEELNTKNQQLCGNLTAENLKISQEAWKATVTVWQSGQSFLVGPAMNRATAIDFKPARPNLIQDAINGSTTLDLSGVEALGAPAKGLPAIEFLLFENDAVLTSFQQSQRRCDLLRLSPNI